MKKELEHVIKKWNEEADEYNQWSELDAEEKVTLGNKHTRIRRPHMKRDICDVLLVLPIQVITGLVAIGHGAELGSLGYWASVILVSFFMIAGLELRARRIYK